MLQPRVVEIPLQGWAPQWGGVGGRKRDGSELQEQPPAFSSRTLQELHSFSPSEEGWCWEELNLIFLFAYFSYFVSLTRNSSWKTRIKKAYCLVWFKIKGKIFSGSYVRVRLWKIWTIMKSNMKILVLWQDTVIENEVRSQVTELKINATRALIQQRHSTAASGLCSENKLWLRCSDTIYCLV